VAQSYDVATYEESFSRIKYRGTRTRAANPGYLGDKVRFSNLKGSNATIKFAGTGISNTGPVGPAWVRPTRT
jgi:hypothetical protein